jgi:ribosomal protein L29
MKHRYKLSFISACPVDGEKIHYDLTLKTDTTTMAEDIADCAANDGKPALQEHLAEQFAIRFPHAAGRLKGTHKAIKIVSSWKAIR